MWLYSLLYKNTCIVYFIPFWTVWILFLLCVYIYTCIYIYISKNKILIKHSKMKNVIMKNDFSDLKAKAQSIRREIDKLDLIKI